MDGQTKRVIHILEDMLRACILDFGGSWSNYLSLIEFSYNNSCQASIQMAPFEVVYGSHCRSLVRWFEIGGTKLLGSQLVQDSFEKVRVIRERLLAARSIKKNIR